MKKKPIPVDYKLVLKNGILKIPKKNSFITPTKKALKYWFNVLNHVIFNGKLVYFDEAYILNKYKFWAEVHIFMDTKKKLYKSLILIHNRFKCLRDFIEIVAHEMVHLYQFQVEKPRENNHLNPKHGPTFYKWKTKFNRYNLTLKEIYNHND